ncbi:MFS transporter [Paenibacillus harenae]|uniref:DHA3 family macrolide efflux protein-like MFS transporter n=1 Tax=Paenibacillus harenae TaxID=306543 RepID=A0ABT9U7R7_PAEHA|nr:MFS transporter [Paenibacillus harenae]MDQ0115696.1 DHA3 family macrolide efflux protein-like MFS transporter [Paenibacillus harenae]
MHYDKNNNYNGWQRKIAFFLSAQTISLFGSSMVQFAIIWYITLHTSSGTMLTITTVCGFLPQIIISLFAGLWIDRYNRKTMIMLADGMIAITTFALAILFLAGYNDIWLLYPVLLIRSFGTGIQTPAVQAIIPQLVPKEQLMRVNGINSSISSLMMFLSPAAGAAVLAFATIEMALLIDVVTALIGIGIMSGITVSTLANKAVEGNSGVQKIKQGFAYLKEYAYIRRLLVFLFAVMLLISPAAFLTPLMVSRSFGSEVWRLSASEMTFSAGMLIGGLIIASWGGFRNRRLTMLLACVLYGLLMIALGAAPTFGLYLLFNLLIGITSPSFNSPLTVMLQEKVEPQMHGRVFSFMQMSNSFALMVGMLLFGPLGDAVRVESLLIAAGVLVVACAGIGWRFLIDRDE